MTMSPTLRGQVKGEEPKRELGKDSLGKPEPGRLSEGRTGDCRLTLGIGHAEGVH